MNHTFNYCQKCQTLNKVKVEKIKDQKAVCGKCGADLHFNGMVVETDSKGLNKIITSSDLPIVVDFWAPWCGPCRMFAPTFEKVSKEFGGKVLFVKVNTEEHQEINQQFGIRGIPTLIKFESGKESKRISGALAENQLKQWMN
jgi:thioredoxin 2